MKEFFVMCRDTCANCHGAQLVMNPLWERFFAETAGQGDPDAWAKDNGFDCAMDMGAEEEPCQVCEGEGRVSSLVPLREAIEAIRANGEQP